ncbi:hypothetical protein ACSBR1_014589 [Camellia fascicularis]
MKASMLRSVATTLRRASSSSSSSPSSTHLLRRSFSSDSNPNRKVAVLGAAGSIGQLLALLMKLNPLISSLSLYDIAGTPGVATDVATDVSHINARAQVAGFMGEEQLGQALDGADLVIILVGVPRKPGMTRDGLFNINAGIVKSLCSAFASTALIGGVRISVEGAILRQIIRSGSGEYDKQSGEFDSSDCSRGLKIFYAGKAKVPVADVNVPLVGGHAGITILPLFSQATPKAHVSDEDIKALTKRTQDGGTERLWHGAMESSIRPQLCGVGSSHRNQTSPQKNWVPNPAVSRNLVHTGYECTTFSLGKNGVEKVLGLGPLSDYEKQGLESLMPELKTSIEKGIKFANQ